MLAPSKTGHLKNSIKTKSEITQDGAKAQVFVGADYGAYVEFGTGQKGTGTYTYSIKGFSIHYRATKWKVKIPDIGVRWIQGQVAQPYLTPAYLYAKNNKTVEKEVATYIEREIKKLERGK